MHFSQKRAQKSPRMPTHTGKHFKERHNDARKQAKSVYTFAVLKKTFFLLLMFFAMPVMALQFSDRYLGGQEACRSNPYHAKETSFQVAVPADYSDSSKGLTSIYAWTHKPFDPEKNSLVFFTGGPGGVAHGIQFDLPQWNIIFFDTRGNSCSRPEASELFFDPSFYSSEWVARDVEALRKYLNIESLTVYGVSYGTVPAHLYGHLFPLTTRAVILEGVVYEGGAALTEPSNRISNLQKFFDDLPKGMQDSILRLSSHPEVSPYWFSKIGMMMLYLDNPFVAFKAFLSSVLEDEKLAVNMIKNFSDTEPFDEAFGYGHMFMAMIGCQELGMSEDGPSFYSRFEGRRLKSSGYSHLKEHYCDSVSGYKVKNYNAGNFLSNAKTFYVQGFLDGATGYKNALLHFQRATQEKAELLLAKQGGHMPLHSGLNSGYESKEVAKAKLKILEKMFLGESLQIQDLKDLERFHPLEWNLFKK